ncbi:MAG: SH3 domain-containing protein [Xenococcaceae cyanobacterium]
MADFIFPLRINPTADYHTPPRAFGSNRSGGRKHAACDLWVPVGTEILAMADGQVIRGPYYFYDQTYALEVRHDNGMVLRYGEISRRLPSGIRNGVRVSQGQIIAYVGELVSLNMSMLHLEMYQGTTSGPLTQSGNIYQRRADLVDPTSYLDNADDIDISGILGDISGTRGTVNSNVSRGLNVRSNPSTTAAVVFTLGPTATCQVLDTVTGDPYPPNNDNQWYQIQKRGQRGFVAAYYLDVEETPQVEGRRGRVNNLVTTFLNIRSAPSTISTIVFRLTPQATCQILEEVTGSSYPPNNNNEWYRIQQGTQQGFAAADYLDVEDDGGPPNGGEETPREERVQGEVKSNVISVLNVRSEPRISANILFTLTRGTVIDVLDEVVGDPYDQGRNDWCQIEYNGQQGYAAGYYININEETQPLTRWDQALPNVPTTGASAPTARQDGLSPGVAASHQMAETDLSRVSAMADQFRTVASIFGVPAAVLAAIASRESRCGNVLDNNGWGDNGNAFGVMQVDRRFHNIEGTSNPRSPEHLQQATGIFVNCLEQVERKHPNWEAPLILKGAAVAYNSGVSNVQTQAGMDVGTTGNDYGSDVMARAQYYANHAQLSIFRS